ncbi:hypothetical protein D354_00296 [Enterococcus faecalis]|nr:hypothetical protein D354_00296 [Enterococcus faecalis]EPI36568.1 hypothetical protein D351_00018 [Enterococcus faecalis WKS-26-18-2]
MSQSSQRKIDTKKEPKLKIRLFGFAIKYYVMNKTQAGCVIFN